MLVFAFVFVGMLAMLGFAALLLAVTSRVGGERQVSSPSYEDWETAQLRRDPTNPDMCIIVHVRNGEEVLQKLPVKHLV